MLNCGLRKTCKRVSRKKPTETSSEEFKVKQKKNKDLDGRRTSTKVEQIEHRPIAPEVTSFWNPGQHHASRGKIYLFIYRFFSVNKE